jgi:predicted extracellular nuclease
MESLGKAMNMATEELGYIPRNAEELKNAIKNNSEAYGLSSVILGDLNSFINDDTFATLLNFTDAMNEATSAALYYANIILHDNVKD